MFDSGGLHAAVAPDAESADETENLEELGGSMGDGAGEGEREGTCMTVTAS